MSKLFFLLILLPQLAHAGTWRTPDDARFSSSTASSNSSTGAVVVTGGVGVGGSLNANGNLTTNGALITGGACIVGGQALGSNGSTSAPSYSFSNASSTGLYRASSTAFGLVANSTEIAQIYPSGLYLNLAGSAATPTIQFVQTNLGLFQRSTSQLAFTAGGSEQGYIADGFWMFGKNGSSSYYFKGSEIQLNNSSTAAANSLIYQNTTSGSVEIAGGNAAATGANVKVYAQSHASKAGVTEFRYGSAINGSIAIDSKFTLGLSGLAAYHRVHGYGLETGNTGSFWQIKRPDDTAGTEIWSGTAAGNGAAIKLFGSGWAGTPSRFEVNIAGTSSVIANATGVSVKGTTTNDNAAAGYIGEVIEGDQPSWTNFAGSGVYGDLTSVALTAGDWDVSVLISSQANGATGLSYVGAGMGTASGTSPTGINDGHNFVNTTAVPNSSANSSVSVPMTRVSIASTTTYYLKVVAGYTGGTPRALGRLTARRAR